MEIISLSNNFSLFLDVSGQQPPHFVVFLHWELFCHWVSLKKMRVRQKSLRFPPESKLSLTGPTFEWRSEVHPGIAKDKVQGLLPQVFGLSRPLPSYLVFYFSVLTSNNILGLPRLSTFFRGCTSCIGPIPTVGGRPPAT